MRKIKLTEETKKGLLEDLLKRSPCFLYLIFVFSVQYPVREFFRHSFSEKRITKEYIIHSGSKCFSAQCLLLWE